MVFQWKDNVLFFENTTYLKNQWTKHRLNYTHFDAFSVLIPNIDTVLNNYKIFNFFFEKISRLLYCTQLRQLRGGSYIVIMKDIMLK